MDVFGVWVLMMWLFLLPALLIGGLFDLIDGIRRGEIVWPPEMRQKKKKPACSGNCMRVGAKARGERVRRIKYGYIIITPQTGRDVKGLRVKTKYRK